MYLVPLTLLGDLKTLLHLDFMCSCASTCCSGEQTAVWLEAGHSCTSACLEQEVQVPTVQEYLSLHVLTHELEHFRSGVGFLGGHSSSQHRRESVI